MYVYNVGQFVYLNGTHTRVKYSFHRPVVDPDLSAWQMAVVKVTFLWENFLVSGFT